MAKTSVTTRPRGLVERQAASRFALTEQGRAVLAALIKR